MARRVNSRDPGAKSQFCVICGKWPATVRPKVPGPAWCEQCNRVAATKALAGRIVADVIRVNILEAEQADRAGK